MIEGVLRIKPQVPPPYRLAHLPRILLWSVDECPCSCGATFGQHDWVLTVAGEITVVTCSKEVRDV
jgi:hypothetical protein